MKRALPCILPWVSFRSEEKDQAESRKDRLKLHGNLHGLQALNLVGSEQTKELRKERLLALSDLLLKGVNLNHEYADLCGISAGIEQRIDLLRKRLNLQNARRKSGLAGLQQGLEFGDLAGLKLKKRGDDLERTGVLVRGVRLSGLRRQLQQFVDGQFGQIGSEGNGSLLGRY